MLRFENLLLNELLLVAQHRQPEHLARPDVVVVDLSDRDVELGLHLVGHPAHDLALRLERRSAGDVECEPGDADEHQAPLKSQ